jgi:ketosteroid isomerase-like protein
MSQENVEIVRGMLAAWNAREMDGVRDRHDPHAAIMRFIEGWPEPGPVVGRDAVMDFYESMRPWEDDTVEPLGEFLESGGAVLVRVRWRSSTQGQEVGMELTPVYTLRGGKIFMTEFFRDHAEALEAVGLAGSGS